MQLPSDNIQLHHTAYVVDDLESAVRRWQQLTGATVERPTTMISAHRVKVAFLLIGGSRVELVQPVGAGSAAGTRVRTDDRLDHLCFLCSDFEERVSRARDDGGIVVRPPVPSEAFEGRRMCFILDTGLGRIEWVER